MGWGGKIDNLITDIHPFDFADLISSKSTGNKVVDIVYLKNGLIVIGGKYYNMTPDAYLYNRKGLLKD